MARLRLRRSLTVLVVATLAGSSASAAGGECAARIGTRVQDRYDKIHDLHARFAQRTERVALGGAPSDVLEASGAVVFAKPGKMRWSYESPEPSLVVSDGETLWIYDERAREVQKLSLTQGFLSAAGVQFLLGSGRLADEFEVTAKGCTESSVTLLLAPKRAAQYERLELHVDAGSGAVAETVVVDLFGNRTTIALHEVRENAGAKPALFRFAPPEGVRVIEVPATPAH